MATTQQQNIAKQDIGQQKSVQEQKRPEQIGNVQSKEGTEFPGGRLASTTPVRDYMTATPAYMFADETIQAAAQKMALHNIGFLPVADREKNMVTGVVTDRDITVRGVANGLLADAAKVTDVMTFGAKYVWEDDTIDTAREVMKSENVRRLVVKKRANEELAGILSLDDIALFGRGRTGGDILQSVAAIPNRLLSEVTTGTG